MEDEIVVRVTEQHIREAREHRANWVFVRSYHCPIAKAVAPLFNYPIAVGGDAIYRRGTNVVLHDLPKEACAFISTYDAGKDVAPFEFRLKRV